LRYFRLRLIESVDAVAQDRRESQAVEELAVMGTGGGLHEVGKRSATIAADTPNDGTRELLLGRLGRCGAGRGECEGASDSMLGGVHGVYRVWGILIQYGR
jgi:hypothetical protein